MAGIRWTLQASDDWESITEFIAHLTVLARSKGFSPFVSFVVKQSLKPCEPAKLYEFPGPICFTWLVNRAIMAA